MDFIVHYQSVRHGDRRGLKLSAADAGTALAAFALAHDAAAVPPTLADVQPLPSDREVKQAARQQAKASGREMELV